MKRTKIIYWTVTVIFAVFMAFTAVPDVMLVPDAVKFMHHLGYPNYFTAFIGGAKILGAIAILIPSFPKIKEWAYAGLFFDLIGATWSVGSADGFTPSFYVVADYRRRGILLLLAQILCCAITKIARYTKVSFHIGPNGIARCF